MRYLGIFVVKAHSFRCSFSHSKRSFFGAVNGKLLNEVSEVVILELGKSKCRWVFCGPTSAARSAKYPLVGPQVRKSAKYPRPVTTVAELHIKQWLVLG